MAEIDILQHLLAIEDEAASLVAEAQREADRRASEAEDRSRSAYQERYAKRAAELERDFEAARASASAEYSEELDRYRAELAAKPVDSGAFRVLAEALLLGER